MKASLDTNVIVHLYRAGQQEILFSCFDEGIYIYEQIREIELTNHGQDILGKVDQDIKSGKLLVIDDQKLREAGVLSLFERHKYENMQLYSTQDQGEAYAISLAQTLGAAALVTDDIKPGGPYVSLLQFVDNDIMPFTFCDVLFLNYLSGKIDANDLLVRFRCINIASSLKWNIKTHLSKFINRFWNEPYQEHEENWMKEFCSIHHVRVKEKISILRDEIRSELLKGDV